MLDAVERTRRAELIIITLAKFRVLLELSAVACPVCRKAAEHDPECPVSLAWSLLDPEQQDEVRRNIRAYALSVGSVNEVADNFIH